MLSAIKILILCTGNSCRSQMARGYLQSFDKRLQVFSAGTQPAAKINAGAVAAMKEAGIDISNYIPVSVDQYVNQVWDYVITVCDDANESCPVFVGEVKNRLHIGFEDPAKVEGSGEFIRSEFRRVRDQIKESFYNLYTEQIKPVLL